MDLGLRGRVAIVTGGSEGIGRAIAESLAGEGVKIVICAVGMDQLEAAGKELRQSGGTVVAMEADVTVARAVQSVVKTCIERFGRLDIVVNNAGGIERFAGFTELADRDWRDAFELNVMSVVHSVRPALPYLRQSAAPRLINIASISGVQPGSYNPHYTVAKAAVINLTKYLANDLAADGILVNAVCPGPVHSASWERHIERMAGEEGIHMDEARRRVEDAESNKIPLGRVGEADDVAGLVTFLASDKAAWVTGSCFHVNGGKLRSIG